MADVMKLIGILQPSTAAASGSQTPRQQLPGEAGSAARNEADTRLQLERLSRFLASGAPPRQDAPRGTYLNIVI
jgi:hypothetical protein